MQTLRYFMITLAVVLSCGALIAQPLVVRGTASLTPRTHIDIVGEFAYTVGANSFAVIDVSDPADPEIVGQLAPGVSTLLSVDVTGDYAYCAGQNSGVVVLEISDSDDPEWVATRILASPVLHVAASGDYALAATALSVSLLDVSDPEDIEILDQYGRAATWLDFDPDRMEAFCGSNSGAFVLEIDDDELSLRDQFGNNALTPVAIAGNYVNFARSAEVPALEIASFNLAGTHEAFGLVVALAGGPGYSFAGLNTGEIQYVDQSQDNPSLAGSANVGSAVTGLAVNPNTRTLVASNSGGVTLLNFDPLDAPEPAPVTPRDFAIRAYPNPFNAATQLRLTADQPGDYTLTVTDVLGRLVRSELIAFEHEQTHELTLTGESAGSYFVRWSGPANTATTRVVYIP